MERESYIVPEMELILFSAEEVITASGGIDEGEDELSNIGLW